MDKDHSVAGELKFNNNLCISNALEISSNILGDK